MQTNRMFVNPRSYKSTATVWLLLVTISVQFVFSKPVQKYSKSQTVISTLVDANLPTYLTKFGYLSESDSETGNLRTDEQLRNALEELQKFGNIPVTGQLDEATKQLIRKPRCGVPDTLSGQHRSKRYTLHGQKWQKVNLTWSLRTRHLEHIDYGSVRMDLHKALQVWSKHSKLTFKEVNSESADILVFFEKGYHGDGYPFDGPGNVLAHAFFPGTGRGGDAHFDEDEEWLINGKVSNDGTSLFMVAAHEFGHSLGLSHSSVQSTLMFPWYQNLNLDFELPDDDRFGIQILYGSKNDRIWGDIPTHTPLSPRPQFPNNIPRITTTTTTTTPMTTLSTRTTGRSTQPSRRPDVRVTPPTIDDKPDFCNTSFDAISIIRRDTFFFKGKYVWRLGTNGLYPGYPALINRLWYNLPDNMTHVDAVYERQDSKVVFFIGRNFYVYNGNVPIPGYPKPLTTLGLPKELDHVDAATVWGHNSKTYIFSGSMYWRYDDETDQMELDYPRDMSIWRGVGYNINAAFQWHDGATYFFKNRDFWKFNDLRMRVEQEEPRSIGQFWFNCTITDGSDKKTNTRTRGRVTGQKGFTGRNGRLQSADEPTDGDSVSSADGHLILPLPLALSFSALSLLFTAAVVIDFGYER